MCRADVFFDGWLRRMPLRVVLRTRFDCSLEWSY